MRKFGLVVALFACIFGFCACEEEKEEQVELKENTRYRLSVMWSDVEADYVEDIFVFAQKDDIGEATYFSSEDDIEVDHYGPMYTPYRDIQDIGYLYMICKIKNKYYIIESYIEKNTDNNIRINKENEIREDEYIYFRDYWLENSSI